MKVAALGRTTLLYNSIKYLKDLGIDIVLIGTAKESPEYEVGVQEFKKLANEVGAEFFSGSNLNLIEIKELIKESKADIAISVNWPNVIKKEVIGVFPYGILNCHAGDLPRYRGNAVMNWAIINNEENITVTIHKMDDGLDSGDIVLQDKILLSKDTKIGDIYSWCNENVPKMFYDSVLGILNGKIKAVQQPKESNLALRCYPRVPSDSYIDWDEDADYINRLIRASSYPFSGAYTYLNGEKLIIIDSYVEKFSCPSIYISGQVVKVDNEKKEVGIATKNEVLIIRKVIYNNKEYKATEIITSMRTRLGIVVEDEIYNLNKKIIYLEDEIKKMKAILCNYCL